MASPAKSATTSVADIDMVEAEEGSAAAAAAVQGTDSLAGAGSAYQSLDALDPRKVAFDIFEVYCQEMLTTTVVERRASLKKHMQYMIKRLIMEQYGYGRLYNRTCIANIVRRICGIYAYEIPDEVDQGGDCLVDFSPERWGKVIVQLEKLRNSMLRNDAKLIILPSQLQLDDGNKSLEDDVDDDFPEEDDEINEALESHTYFSKGYMEILDLMKFHTCLSHLQPQLERVIQGRAETDVIPHENITAFESAIEKLFGNEEDNKYARILDDLLEDSKDAHLKSFDGIKEIYDKHDREFDLEHFQHNFLQLIRRWNELVLPVPELSKLNYGSNNSADNVTQNPMAASVHEKENMLALGANIGDRHCFSASESMKQQHKGKKRRDERKRPPESITTSLENEVGDDLIDSASEDETEERVGARGDLRIKRKAFMKNVKDPLDSSVATAKTARLCPKVDKSEGEDSLSNGGRKVVKTPTFLKKKKSARQIQFDSDSDSADVGAALSEVPTRYESPKRKAPPNIHISRKNPGRKRIPFTEEETNAILDGAEKLGVGNWADIKAHPDYSYALRNRTSIQIKDRWRTMVNQGLIEEGSG